MRMHHQGKRKRKENGSPIKPNRDRWAVREAEGLAREAALARDAARWAVGGVVGLVREAVLEREAVREAWVMEGGVDGGAAVVTGPRQRLSEGSGGRG